MATGTTNADRAVSLLETNVRTYMEIKNAYDECTPEIRAVIDDMVAIYSQSNADDQQKWMAMHTIIEALFPSLAADLMDNMDRIRAMPETEEYEKELDAQEATFAERLKEALEAKGWTQWQLAEQTGVKQPAISNMLNRQSRPQMRTVKRFAEALGIPPEQLWPGFEK